LLCRADVYVYVGDGNQLDHVGVALGSFAFGSSRLVGE
jgi:hypothetical protein